MTAFIVFRKGIWEKYHAVRDTECIGMPCLKLGEGEIYSGALFGDKKKTNCCVTMVETGCPSDVKYSLEEFEKNVNAGYYVRIV